MYLLDICLPGTVIDYLGQAAEQDYLTGTLTLTNSDTPEVNEEAQLGWIDLSLEDMALCLRATTPAGGEGIVAGRGESPEFPAAECDGKSETSPKNSLTPKNTRFQVFATTGISFPFGLHTRPPALDIRLSLNQLREGRAGLPNKNVGP